MKDDGIAIAVAEHLEDTLKEENTEIILGETDSLSCYEMLEENDFVILIDAQLTGAEAGTICVYDLQDLIKNIPISANQHNISVIDLMKLHHRSFRGRLIGIEAEIIDFGLELGDTLTVQFEEICKKVKNTVKEMILEE
jgi:hydrogenase maturation protease